MRSVCLPKIASDLRTAERLGPKERASYVSAEMRSWNPRTILSWSSKAWDYRITGLLNMQGDLFSIHEVFTEWEMVYDNESYGRPLQ